MQHLRKTGDEQLAQQRWQASQTSREQAAINGQLGPQAQILALSELYRELRSQGRIDEAMALKARVNAIVEGK